MTSANGVQPTPHTEVLEATPEPPEPELEAYSLDYWTEMTQRQVERLQARLDELEAQAAPLRQQLTALRTALTAVTGRAGPGGEPPRLGPNGLRVKTMSPEERLLIRQMVYEGKSSAEVMAALPHLPKKAIWSTINRDKREFATRQAHEANRR
jgi:hypothetical protein